MFGFLDSKVTLRHLVILGVMVAVPYVGANALAGGSTISSLLPAGTVRMASTSSTSSVNVDLTTGETRVLHVSVNVPLHKHADLQATFSASIHHNPGTYAYCFGTITLDTSPPSGKFKPGQQQLLGGATATEPDAVSAAMVAYRTAVGAGVHTVNVYINPAYAGCQLQERALNVLVNLY